MGKTIITFAIVALMLVGVAYAFPPGPGFGPGAGAGREGRHHHGPGEFGSALQLTPEQKAKFDEFRSRFRQENAQLIGAMVAKRIELQSLWSDPKADPNAIARKEGELRDLRNQLGDKALQMKLEARKILTPEQIARWKPGMSFGHDMRPGKEGWGGGPGQGCRGRF